MVDKKKQDIPFEEVFQKLEKIVEALEKGDSTLDDAMKSFEEGMGLVEVCMKKLTEAEARLQKIVKSEDGQFRLESME
jgi:exodeoxyribonuclease VII small subunit